MSIFMNAKFIKIHVEGTVPGLVTSSRGSVNVASTLDGVDDEKTTAPSIALMKEYVDNISFSALFSNGANLNFLAPTLTNGEVELDVVGPDGPVTKDYPLSSIYESLRFDPSDFHLSSIAGKLNIETRALKRVGVDDTVSPTMVEILNFLSNSNIRVEHEVDEETNRHNIGFHLNRYNDIFKRAGEIVLGHDYPNIVRHKITWDETLNNQFVQYEPSEQAYQYIGPSVGKVMFHIQMLYDWVNSDLAYRFRLNIYMTDNGDRQDVFTEAVGINDIVNSVSAYTNTVLLELQPLQYVHFEMLFDAEFPFKIFASSFLFTEYID